MPMEQAEDRAGAPHTDNRARTLEIQRLNQKWIGCAACDALWERPTLKSGQRARCRRCHTIIYNNRPEHIEYTLALTTASLFLYCIAMASPFLKLERAGLSHQMSVVDTATVLWQNGLRTLSVIVALFVIIFPIIRMIMLIYVCQEVVGPKTGRLITARVFRTAEKIDRWTMSEIFVIGVMVSLVEITSMAKVDLLPGFWAMAVMIVLLAFGSTNLSRDSIWADMRGRHKLPHHEADTP